MTIFKLSSAVLVAHASAYGFFSKANQNPQAEACATRGPKFDILPTNDINGFPFLFSEEKNSCPISE
jgi:hypothetical protein